MLFFFGAIVILNWVMINLFIAVIASAYTGTVVASATEAAPPAPLGQASKSEAYASFRPRIEDKAEQALHQLVIVQSGEWDPPARGRDSVLALSGTSKLRAVLTGPANPGNPRPVYLLSQAPNYPESQPRYSVEAAGLPTAMDMTPRRIRDEKLLRRIASTPRTVCSSVNSPASSPRQGSGVRPVAEYGQWAFRRSETHATHCRMGG